MRAYKTVNDSYIEPISFTVPRRAEVFQSDIYPPATGSKPAVSAEEWLSGKDGIPAKIDLESVYDGNAPMEVSPDYKPPTPAPAPAPTPSTVKAPAPAKEEATSVATQRVPPPSMKEQKGSIAAMANKFQDDEAEDDDDASSFEEIAKPIQKHIPVAAKVEAKPSSPIKTSPTKTSPPKPEPVSQPRSYQPPVVAPTPTAAPTSANSSSSGVEASLAQIKSLLEAQTKTITAQSEKIGQLAQEVDTLK